MTGFLGLGLGLVLVVAAILIFNRLVRLRNLVRNSWSDVDVQLKRRAALVPNLVEVVRGYTGHERQVLEEVTQARTRVQAAGDAPAEREAAERALAESVGKLMALAEAYPELKASTQYARLQAELVSLEQDLASSRQYYNAVVRDYNSAIQSVPQVFFAGLLGFEPAEYFAADDDVRALPEVSFT